MAGLNWNKSFFSLLLVSGIFLVYVKLSQAASMMDWVNRCCVKGKQKAINFNGAFEVCNTDDLDRRNFTIMDRMVCRISERVCCVKELQKVACERGKYQAFQAKSCARPHGNAGADRYIECCDCCALGIKARSTGVGCDQVKFGNPCNTVYQECCSGQKVTASPYATAEPPLVLTPAPSTKQPSGQGCASGVCQHICREDSARNPICYCRNGYFIASNKRNCLDVNECTMSTPVCYGNQRCINTEGSFRCVQDSAPTPTVLAACLSAGYELVRGSCQDINECNRGTSTCSSEQICVNTVGSYRCTCARGYVVSGQTCVDKDECSTREARCPPGSVCRNLQGSYICSRPDQCPAGKQKTASGCVDIDECANGDSPCDSDTRCINTDGSYRCVPCGKGFQVDNNRCVDKDECTNGEARCPRGRVCKNTLGSYTCTRRTCPTGKRLTTSGCVDIDECATNRANCNSNSRCINTDGSYRCVACPTGTRAENNACIDIDECAENRYTCRSNQRCANTPGSYRCVDVQVKACLSGYKNVNGRCVDIDECVEFGVKCPRGQQCKNEKGSYSCSSSCTAGYQLVNGRCEDIDECVEYRVRCPSGEVCANIPGSYRCQRAPQCSPGYEFRNGRCLDIDECRVSNPCFAGQRCENYAGSYRCVADVTTTSCPRGYKRVNGKCVVGDRDPCTDRRCPSGYECKVESNRPVCKDIDECRKNPCKSDEICVNKPGRHFCLCRTGYERNQYTQRCEDVNECRKRVCSHNCVNFPPGSFTCSCHSGYKLAADKRRCIDINECATLNPCQNGRCINTQGSYLCSCSLGFRLGASGRCEDINECDSADIYGSPCDYNCTNLIGSYSCGCPRGYEQTADKFSCNDMDECRQDPGICGDGTVCRNTYGHYRCIPFTCPQPYYQLIGESKCQRKCPEGDQVCPRLKDKVYQFWTFNIHKSAQKHNLFTYKVIPRGYRNPDVRYRFRSGNELGHFEIKRLSGYLAQVWTRVSLTESRDYVLDFVGELYDGSDLISRYVNTLYVFVSQHKFRSG